jgi:hypothetical protein
VDAIAGKVADFLMAQGLSGIVIIGLGFSTYKLFLLYVASLEERVKEATKHVEIQRDNAEALDKLSDYVRGVNANRQVPP